MDFNNNDNNSLNRQNNYNSYNNNNNFYGYGGSSEGRSTKYIIVTGGVISGLGKGVAAASIGNLLSNCNYKVVPMKCDGYLNVDPGTMNPQEHGEVFVLDDGAEVDMDFGHYERFLNVKCKKEWSLTMGKVFQEILQKERNGDYLGHNVELIPHVTDLIKSKYISTAKKENADVMLIEVGGAVGQMENNLFIEACRQLKKDVGRKNILYVHLTYIPIPTCVNEPKSKPTQQSVDLLRQRGIQPDIIIGRCRDLLTPKIKHKISTFCDVEEDEVISGVDVDSIYKIPILYEKENISKIIKEKIGLDSKVSQNWKLEVDNLDHLDKEVTVAICGKYTDLEDSYASVVEALKHCSANLTTKINIKMIETSTNSVENLSETLKGVSAVIVPGGFGSRGIEGKIKIIQYVRENKIPYLGICYGLQLAVIEFLRNVCGIKEASSLEIDENTKCPAITLLDEQKRIVKKGGTMRLGAYEAVLMNGKIKKYYEMFDLIQNDIVSERHRHRFEVNPEFVPIFEEKGLKVVGFSKERRLVEFIELDESKHPYFVATQAHPELKSKLDKPAPLFYGLIKATIERRN
ncbi:MAG: CTP synthase (glutamine hydrolyzing) [Nanoarchaeota archaeon]|nr:CTP synthase (glutamine hydrolyzing) [Nanoarchaeota archaeon]